MAQSLPIPAAPLLAGSLPPSRFDDVPPLSLGPQVRPAPTVWTFCRILSHPSPCSQLRPMPPLG